MEVHFRVPWPDSPLLGLDRGSVPASLDPDPPQGVLTFRKRVFGLDFVQWGPRGEGAGPALQAHPTQWGQVDLPNQHAREPGLPAVWGQRHSRGKPSPRSQWLVRTLGPPGRRTELTQSFFLRPVADPVGTVGSCPSALRQDRDRAEWGVGKEQ